MMGKRGGSILVVWRDTNKGGRSEGFDFCRWKTGYRGIMNLIFLRTITKSLGEASGLSRGGEEKRGEKWGGIDEHKGIGEKAIRWYYQAKMGGKFVGQKRGGGSRGRKWDQLKL